MKKIICIVSNIKFAYLKSRNTIDYQESNQTIIRVCTSSIYIPFVESDAKTNFLSNIIRC
ncbi:hypothetical protein HanPSC8_Chr03g0110431 [Helianthus annuus]|nr:hypothetical protein HanPSC8_Chr03g0110431 [Helianthus annuus]